MTATGIQALAPWINSPTNYLAGGEALIGGDDRGWRQVDDRRVFEHEVVLEQPRPTEMGLGLFDGSYKAARLPRMITAVSLLEADDHVNYSVEMLHPLNHVTGERIPGSRYVLTVTVWGPGRLKAIKVSWTAIAMCQLGSGG